MTTVNNDSLRHRGKALNMSGNVNPVAETYSKLAGQYDAAGNMYSCWGRATEKALGSIKIRDNYKRVLDVGCGSARALLRLASRCDPGVQFMGVDPAANMRKRAIERTRNHANVDILEGSFEQMPIESGSVDYLYSILAFHWTTDIGQSIDEVLRVLRPDGEMDLIFIGRNNGREFIRGTTPVFLKYMGPALLLESVSMRKQLSRSVALEHFGSKFDPRRLTIEESYETYYDTLEGHWAWWVRIEAHFVKIPSDSKEQCDREVKKVISSLETDRGIPYTIHLLHVKLRCA